MQCLRHVTWNVILLDKLIVFQLVKLSILNTVMRLGTVSTRTGLGLVGSFHPTFLRHSSPPCVGDWGTEACTDRACAFHASLLIGAHLVCAADYCRSLPFVILSKWLILIYLGSHFLCWLLLYIKLNKVKPRLVVFFGGPERERWIREDDRCWGLYKIGFVQGLQKLKEQ
jgi:hypothetical protein